QRGDADGPQGPARRCAGRPAASRAARDPAAVRPRRWPPARAGRGRPAARDEPRDGAPAGAPGAREAPPDRARRATALLRLGLVDLRGLVPRRGKVFLLAHGVSLT